MPNGAWEPCPLCGPVKGNDCEVCRGRGTVRSSRTDGDLLLGEPGADKAAVLRRELAAALAEGATVWALDGKSEAMAQEVATVLCSHYPEDDRQTPRADAWRCKCRALVPVGVGVTLHQAQAVVVAVLARLLSTEEEEPGEHVQREQVYDEGRTYCSCGRQWPCPEATQ